MRSGQLPSLNAVRAFEASARHLNFRLAAEELGVTQGAVAQHVRGLEDSLGLKLFLRLPRTLALTDQGRAYAGTIRRAFELIVEGTAALRPQPVCLSISVTPTFASKWLLPRLPGFAARHPELSLGIVATDRISSFQPEGIDIAVRYGPAPADPQLEADLLFREELVGVCSPLLLAGTKTPLSADRLDGYVLLHDAHSRWPEFIETLSGRTHVGDNRNVHFNQTALAIDAALGGQGIALASRGFVEADLAAGRLVDAFGVTMQSDRAYYVVTPRKPRFPLQVATVRAWLLSNPDV
ncbi:MAG TPA: LysR substrate-binding domain-containing protein [Mesorhizobium sp.]|jgi:LysR family glycine cleavage system transcriptional activator|uniref:LysR substrate-binding domain-containing protein n=1 Tax=Mesorhizobium sp. TaxID=1871066 RepID=UPI002DDCECE2|nr:LysR substrate-binding domain-containing protein [Mesorhizobium sp.]HEV2505265.1 LysR substrate-binding domain-containing protein [Mesorhizobium sp.]